MRLKKVLTLALIAACGMGLASCTAESKKTEQVMTQEKATYQKKYTNADFYKDGKFDQEAAKEAFLDMFKFYGVPYTPLMEKDIWFTDFGLGDFENVGMGGIFWVNDPEYGYFAHAIYLLPGQMIPEHAHVKTAFPAKHKREDRAEFPQHMWYCSCRERIYGSDPHCLFFRPKACRPLLHSKICVQNLLDILHQFFSVAAQAHVSSFFLEERNTVLVLQCLDRMAEPRLGNIQRFCRFSVVLQFCQLCKIF